VRVSDWLPGPCLVGGVAKSKRELNDFILSGAITINGEKVINLEELKILNYNLIKRGKRNNYLLVK